MANCPMCGYVWNEAKCKTCGWFEGKPQRYTPPRRKRRKSPVAREAGCVTADPLSPDGESMTRHDVLPSSDQQTGDR